MRAQLSLRYVICGDKPIIFAIGKKQNMLLHTKSIYKNKICHNVYKYAFYREKKS